MRPLVPINHDDSPPTGRKWYVVQTHPHRESMAAAQLTNQAFEVYLPRYSKVVRHARRVKSSMSPLFPGYLFIALDLQHDRWYCVNGTFGVARLIMGAEFPLPVPRGVVEEIMALQGNASLVDAGPVLKPGDEVRLVNGPFAERLGILRSLDGRGRVNVLLQMMGGSIAVNLGSHQVVVAA